MEHIQRAVCIVLIGSWGLLAAGLCVSVLRWLWTQERVALGERRRRDLRKVWRMAKRIARRLGRRVAERWATYREKRKQVPIQFLVADDEVRRLLRPYLRRGLDRLARATGARLPAESAVLVQRTIERDTPLSGLNLTLHRPGQGPRVLLRVALEVDGIARTPDQMLSTLAEQYIALVGAGTGVPSDTGGRLGATSPIPTASTTDAQVRDPEGSIPPSSRPQLVVISATREDPNTVGADVGSPRTVETPTSSCLDDPLVGPAAPAERAG